jgi:tetratricopeptide (TPR) repeat protein
MERAFRRAVGRDPDDWYAHFELALAESALGRRRAAMLELREAARLNPREPLIGPVSRRVAAGRPVDREAVDRLFSERVQARVGP